VKVLDKINSKFNKKLDEINSKFNKKNELKLASIIKGIKFKLLKHRKSTRNLK
jgi:hypothetical protein